ncbi:MAG: hypothetical protein AB8F65_12505 [Woeseiaceae bacterium]
MTDKKPFEQRVIEQLEVDVDADTRDKLRQARRLAVAAADRPEKHSLLWLPVTGSVAAGVLAFALLRESGPEPLPQMDEQELEAALELELLEELDMLAWMASGEVDAG